MIVGLGNDVCNIARMERVLQKFGPRFLARSFSPAEQVELQSRHQSPAAAAAKKFAAKEAFAKALGSGFVDGMQWSEVEILHKSGGQPYLKVGGKSAEKLRNLAPKSRLWLALSDDFPVAAAVVIIETVE